MIMFQSLLSPTHPTSPHLGSCEGIYQYLPSIGAQGGGELPHLDTYYHSPSPRSENVTKIKCEINGGAK